MLADGSRKQKIVRLRFRFPLFFRRLLLCCILGGAGKILKAFFSTQNKNPVNTHTQRGREREREQAGVCVGGGGTERERER